MVSLRAHASSCSSSDSDGAGSKLCASSMARQIRGMSVNRTSPARNRSTAASFEALRTTSKVPASASDLEPQISARKRMGRRFKIERPGRRPVHLRARNNPAAPGYVSCVLVAVSYPAESWATHEPSTNSTSECMTGADADDLNLVRFQPEQPFCLNHFEALFISVAESIVIRSPMSGQVLSRASSGRAASGCSRDQPRNGPPLAVRITRRTSSHRPAAQALKDRRCSLLCGQQLGPSFGSSGDDQRPGDDRGLLVCECDSLSVEPPPRNWP